MHNSYQPTAATPIAMGAARGRFTVAPAFAMASRRGMANKRRGVEGMGSVSAHEGLEVEAAGARPVCVRRRIAAILIAAPALLVPIIVGLAIYWARQSFQQSPAAIAAGSRTISRAISEPGIADIFAPTISLAAVLLAVAILRIILLLRAAIEAGFAPGSRSRWTAMVALVLAGIAEACGIAGMVALSWLSQRDLHIGASYLFFFGQASAILSSGVLSRMLLQSRAGVDNRGWAKSGLSPRLTLLRSRTAPGIAVAALVFWILYLVRAELDRTPDWLERIFSGLEIALIVSFLLYLATFSVELFRSQQGCDPDVARRHR